MREKLVELLKKAKAKKQYDFLFGDIDTAIDMPHGAEYYADYLIANDVTVQEWRSVAEPPKEAGEYIVMIKNGTSATTLLFDGDFWFEENGDGEMVHYAVTHWMPMPQPPKGE